MKIYVARPITGLTFEEVAVAYLYARDVLRSFGYEVFYAFCGKGYLCNETNLKAEGYEYPLSTDHCLTLRDRWMVKQSDVLYLNLSGAKRVSIGSMMELAWAFDHGKHCVVVMEQDNIHRHAFVLETAHVVFETEDQALDYLKKLAGGDL